MITNTRLDVIDNGIFLDELLATEYKDNSHQVSSESYNPTFVYLTEMYQVGEGVLGDFCSEDNAKSVYERRCDNKAKIHYTFNTIEDFAKYERTVFKKVKDNFLPLEDPNMLIENIDSVIQFNESVFAMNFKSEYGAFNVGLSYTGEKVTNSEEDTIDVIIFTPYWFVLDIYSIPVSQIKNYINEMILEYINGE